VAAGADAFLAARLGLSPKPDGRSRPGPDAATHLTPKAVARAMRTFASAALIVLGPGKDRLLLASGLNEAAWMGTWRLVFDYQPEDLRAFNETLLPAGQTHGLDGLEGLSGQAARLIDAALACGGETAGATDARVLQNALLRDVAAILRTPHEETSHALCH